jgi:hypothetical protein
MRILCWAFSWLFLGLVNAPYALGDTAIPMPEGWKGIKLEAADGSFESCVAGSQYDHGTTMHVVVTKNGDWSAIFANKERDLSSNEKLPFSFNFDGGTEAVAQTEQAETPPKVWQMVLSGTREEISKLPLNSCSVVSDNCEACEFLKDGTVQCSTRGIACVPEVYSCMKFGLPE